MVADFIALLGARAPAPDEHASSWDLDAYLGLLDRPGLEAQCVDVIERSTRGTRLDPVRMRAVLVALARNPTSELNKAGIADASGMPVTTLPPYLEALAAAGAVRLLPGCRSPAARRAIGRPRAVIADPALARHLGGSTLADLARFDGRRRLAPLLRSVVVGELIAQRAASAVEHRLSHLRERNGLTVDLVVELPDDSLYGIEVRTAASLRPHQFAGLRLLAERAGGRFRGGVVLNTARRGHRYGYRMWSLPISTVWE